MGAEASQQQYVNFEEITRNRTLPLLPPRPEFLIPENDTRFTNCEKVTGILKKIFETFENPVNILEVGCGNGYKSNIIANIEGVGSLKATDIHRYKNTFYEVEIASSEVAVRNYVGCIDILLLISPPPNDTFMDYYAIKEYEIRDQSRPKFLLFLGEMGASDGSTGIYKYLMEDSGWKLLERKTYFYEAIFEIRREVFFFKFQE